MKPRAGHVPSLIAKCADGWHGTCKTTLAPSYGGQKELGIRSIRGVNRDSWEKSSLPVTLSDIIGDVFFTSSVNRQINKHRIEVRDVISISLVKKSIVEGNFKLKSLLKGGFILNKKQLKLHFSKTVCLTQDSNLRQ